MSHIFTSLIILGRCGWKSASKWLIPNHTLEEALGKRFLRGVVLYTGRETVPFAKNLHAMPVDALWRLR